MPHSWRCFCQQPSFSLSHTDKTDDWGGTGMKRGVIGRRLVILSSRKSCTFTWSHWAVWEGGSRGCSVCWGVREGCRADLPLHAATSGICRVWSSAWSRGTDRGPNPRQDLNGIPVPQGEGTWGGFQVGWSSNAYGCTEGPDAFLLCQERNFPSTFQSSLPILHSLSSSLSVYICSIQHFQDVCVRLFSVQVNK